MKHRDRLAMRIAALIAAAGMAAACAQSPRQAIPAKADVDASQELIRTCRYDEADRALTEKLAAADARERPMVLLALGFVAEHRGDLAGALRHYEAATAGDTVPLEALKLLGLAQVRAKRFDEGYRHLNTYMAEVVRKRRQPWWQETAAASVALAELGRIQDALSLLDGALAAFDYIDLLLPDLRALARRAEADGESHAGEFWRMAYGSDQEASTMDLDYPPRAIKRVVPQYPETALRHHIEGTVTLRVALDEKGSLTEVAVVASSPKGVFDSAAARAVQEWKFQPATKRCVPVKHRALQNIQFRMSR
jgi:TonB family protein